VLGEATLAKLALALKDPLARLGIAVECQAGHGRGGLDMSAESLSVYAHTMRKLALRSTWFSDAALRPKLSPHFEVILAASSELRAWKSHLADTKRGLIKDSERRRSNLRS
jgi:hypothetical protein